MLELGGGAPSLVQISPERRTASGAEQKNQISVEFLPTPVLLRPGDGYGCKEHEASYSWGRQKREGCTECFEPVKATPRAAGQVLEKAMPGGAASMVPTDRAGSS